MERSSTEHAYSHSHRHVWIPIYARSVDRGACFSFALPVPIVSGFLSLFTQTMVRMCKKNVCRLPVTAAMLWYGIISCWNGKWATFECRMHAIVTTSERDECMVRMRACVCVSECAMQVYSVWDQDRDLKLNSYYTLEHMRERSTISRMC